MKANLRVVALFILTFTTEIVLAVDQNSAAYKAGNITGKIFVVVLLFLIIKKVISKK